MADSKQRDDWPRVLRRMFSLNEKCVLEGSYQLISHQQVPRIKVNDEQTQLFESVGNPSQLAGCEIHYTSQPV